jgi:hypothetical protein
MTRRKWGFLLLALGIAGFGAVGGCSDDDPVGPEPFALTLTVVDASEAPVAGLEARLHVPLPGIFDGAAKARTVVPFDVAVSCSVRITVSDMEGRDVATLFEDAAPAGPHQVSFSSVSDGPLVGTRLYRCRMTAWDGLEQIFTEEVLMTLYASLDFAQRPVLGTTDAAGTITFTDRREFPFLYDVWPQPLVDENGLEMGTFACSDTVRITLSDPTDGRRDVHEVVVGPGMNRFRLVWDPPAVPPAVDTGPLRSTTAGPPPIDAPPPLLVFDLHQNLPNPFN